MLQDTMIICNFNGTLMNKGIWGDPDVFRPDRFIDAAGSIVIPDQYTPFGFGKLLPSYSGSDMMWTPNFKI
jgi:cytochrome P450